MAETIIARTRQAHKAPAIEVGDLVIRKCEPKHRYEESPLQGTVLAVRNARARVAWSNAVRYAGGRRGDNTSSVKISALVPATEANLAKARAKLRGKRAEYWERRAQVYLEDAEMHERQGRTEVAEWMRQEALDASTRAERCRRG